MKFVPAAPYRFCLALLEGITQPGARFLADLCTFAMYVTHARLREKWSAYRCEFGIRLVSSSEIICLLTCSNLVARGRKHFIMMHF